MVIPIPYRERCKNCKHPSKFHTKDRCLADNCKCDVFIKEVTKDELCIDAQTLKPICNYCLTDKNIDRGMCVTCRKLEEKKQKGK